MANTIDQGGQDSAAGNRRGSLFPAAVVATVVGIFMVAITYPPFASFCLALWSNLAAWQ